MSNIAVHFNPTIPWQKRWIDFFITGFKKHNINVSATTSRKRLPDCEIAVLFGPNSWKTIEKDGSPYIMVNRKFMGAEEHVAGDIVALSWDGFNGKGFHCVEEVSTDRINNFIDPEIEIQDWKMDGEDFLLCGQADLGRCTEYRDLESWYNHVRSLADAPVKFRAHPTRATLKPLEDDLRNVKAAVTLNSLVAVEILMAGIPVITMDKCSAVYGVTGHALDDIKYPDRLKMLQHLAHGQWHYTEIENGKFWEQLHSKSGQALSQALTLES